MHIILILTGWPKYSSLSYDVNVSEINIHIYLKKKKKLLENH